MTHSHNKQFSKKINKSNSKIWEEVLGVKVYLFNRMCGTHIEKTFYTHK